MNVLAGADQAVTAPRDARRQRIRVDTGSRAYDILVGTGLLDDPDGYAGLAENKVALIVSNTTVAPLYAQRLANALRATARSVSVMSLEDGEAHKTWASVERIVDALLAAGADRHALLFALGGGVVGDLAGFAAACYMRGIGYVQIPTTLLAQVDSSVGGKTAINHPTGKNLIGAFHQPRLVVADLQTLETLPQREFIAGLAEVIKYGIAADPAFFEWIETHLDDLLRRQADALSYAITRSCTIKAGIVARDERESGLRAILNLGHTFGHAIEAVAGFGTWLHGEAVGCGMVLAADLSCQLGLIDLDCNQRIARLVVRAGLPVRLSGLEARQLLAAMQHDKKAEGGAPRFVLIEALGLAKVCPVEARRVLSVLGAAGAVS